MNILGLGTALPPGRVPQDLAAALAVERCCDTPQQARLLQSLYRQTSVRSRGSVLDNGPGRATPGDFYPPPNGHRGQGPGVAERMRTYAAQAPGLAETAARAAIAEAGVAPADVAQLVVVSCTGFSSPGVEFELIQRLGLPATVGRTSIGFMGCHGAINGLRVTRALAAAQPGRPVLMCAVELCSLHFQYGWNPQQIVANALFGDGAGALVGVAHGPNHVDAATPHTAPAMARVLDTRSCLVPESTGDMTWIIGDHGFEMTLSPRVPSLIEEHLRPWLTAWLAEHGLAIGDVGSWVVHPGGPRVLAAAETALSLPAGAADPSREVLAEHGNMSSPTVLFILDRLRRKGALRLPCVMLAFGPGLVVEGAILR